MGDLQFVMKPRNERIGELMDQCVRDEISFDTLCIETAKLGFTTRSLYEILIARKKELGIP